MSQSPGFDFDAAVVSPFRMQPGLRRLAPGAQQLTPAGAGSRHQREKLAVLTAFADEALQTVPGFDAAPALQALANQAAHEHPACFSFDGQTAQALGVAVAVQDGQVQRLSSGSFGTGEEVHRCLSGLAPEWRLAGLICLAFEEDFAVVDASTDDQPATLPWLAVSLPSLWSPREKCGLPFAQAHAPVADNGLLVQAADPLMRLVTAEQRWERFVWNITPHPRLNALPAVVDPARWRGRFDPALAWWRTEHQTFIPLPKQRQAVFTIGVQLQHLPMAVQSLTPAQVAALHAAVASMSAAVLDYRGLGAVREPLLNWLQARASD